MLLGCCSTEPGPTGNESITPQPRPDGICRPSPLLPLGVGRQAHGARGRHFRQGHGATPVTLAKANRGGYNKENVKRLRKLGVRDVGMAPRGRTPWEVEGKAKERLIRECGFSGASFRPCHSTGARRFGETTLLPPDIEEAFDTQWEGGLRAAISGFHSSAMWSHEVSELEEARVFCAGRSKGCRRNCGARPTAYN